MWKTLLLALTAQTCYQDCLLANPQAAYIQTHLNLAVNEMYRAGVPASITLAQAILESGSGTSELAVGANNHFGIKCGNGWSGENYYHKTKEQHPNGEIVTLEGVCFRKYATAAHSYNDRSNYLVSRSNYKQLFLLDPTDYKGWAKGLVNAGYATDLAYEQKLVSLIETHQLQQYDQTVENVFNSGIYPIHAAPKSEKDELKQLRMRVEVLEKALVEAELFKSQLQFEVSELKKIVKTLVTQQKTDVRDLNQKISVLDASIYSQEENIHDIQKRLQKVEASQQHMLKLDPFSNYFEGDGTPKSQLEIFPARKKDASGTFYQSGKRATNLPENKNLFELAQEYQLEYREILGYNDLLDQPETELPKNCFIYLEAKSTNIEDAEKDQHEVRSGENMHLISQLYGIKLSKLLQRNLLKKGEEPKVGEHILLTKTRSTKPTLRPNQETQPQINFGGGGSGGK